MADPTLVYGFEESENCKIQKRLVKAGSQEHSFEEGTKVTFHYLTRKCDDEQTVIDDSHTHNKPMELIIGKKFKFEVWETCLKTAREGETAAFKVDQCLLTNYPMISKSLRDIQKGKHEERKHCCGMTLQETGLGYPDLDDLLRNPQDLEFILEILKIEDPGDYKKDAWIMNEQEQLDSIPKLREEGNKRFKEKKYTEAEAKYSEAIGLLEQLLLREKPHDVTWNALNDKKMPLLLNYSQCKLLSKDYYAVIQHTSEVLETDPDNVKALFRRAKAHVGAWDPEEARINYQRAAKLDPSLQRAVNKELQLLDELQKQRDSEDKEKLQGKMFK